MLLLNYNSTQISNKIIFEIIEANLFGILGNSH